MPAIVVVVDGIKPVLETLRMFEPTVYKRIQKDIANRGKFIVTKVKQEFPVQPWEATNPVNWTLYGRTKRGRKPEGTAGASFPRYRISDVRKGVAVRVGGRKRRDGTYPIMTIRQTNAGGVIYDLAKNNRTAGKESFVRNLNATGKPSRVMWPTVLKNKKSVEVGVMKIVNEVEKQFSAQIARESLRRQNQSIQASKQVRNALGQFGKMR